MVRRKSRILSMLLSVVLLFGMIGYINIDNTYAASKKIHLKKTTVSLVAGKTYQQKLINKNGKTIKATKVKWKSAKTSVAKINKKGKITTIKPGTAKMTAKYKGKTYKFTVKVKNVFAKGEKPKVTVNAYKQYLLVSWTQVKDITKYQCYLSINGGKYKLVPRDGGYCVRYLDASDLKIGNKYSFKVRAVSGKCYSAFSKVVSVVYSPKNTEISVNPSSISMKVGERKEVNVWTNAGCDVSFNVDNSNVKCELSGYEKYYISQTLYITGIEPGKATVEVFDLDDNSLKASIHVTVTPDRNTVKQMNLSLESDTLLLGKNNRTHAIVSTTPSDADTSTLTWKSSDESIAVVDQAGNITGTGAGEAIITADTGYGITASCTIMVLEPNIESLVQFIEKNGNVDSEGRISYSKDENIGSELWRDIIDLDKRSESLIFQTLRYAKGSSTTEYVFQTAMFCWAMGNHDKNVVDTSFRTRICPNGVSSSPYYDYEMDGTINAKEYNLGDSANWTVTQDDPNMPMGTGLVDTADISLEVCMERWNAMLEETTGFTLSDIGFVNVK